MALGGPARAASLEQVRVFAGDGHARVLLVTRGTPAGLQARSSPPLGVVPARATVRLDGTSPGTEGERTIVVGERGIQRIAVAAVGDAVQVTVEMDAPRSVRAEALGASAVIVDLLGEGRGVDPGLPTAAQLQAWVEGVSLVRAAGGPPRPRRLVVVDPGHGGYDHGAVGVSGSREADIVLELARRMRRGLEEDLGVEVRMTRDTDEFVTLRERAAIANRHDADVFVSVHANAAPGPAAWGIETYSLDTASDEGAARVAARENAIVREQKDEGEADPLLANLVVTGTNQLSRALAAEVQTTCVRRLAETYGAAEVNDLGPKTALFAVLVSTRMPAILFESSFLSNPRDERRLRTPHHQEVIAGAIVESVGAWMARQGPVE